MIDERANWLIKARSTLALVSTVLALDCIDAPAVHAQNFMRSPSINIESRIPTINRTLAPRIDPNIAARTGIMIGRTTAGINGLAIERMTRRYPACGYAYRDGAGQCLDAPITSADGGGSGPLGKKASTGPRRAGSQTTDLGARTIAGQIVAEIDGSLTDAQADQLARRHGLARLQSQNFPLIGATIGLFRVTDRRQTDVVSRQLAAEASVRSVQPNFRYLLQDQKPALTEGDPAQYAVLKLRLPEAHTLAHGANVTIAVIDSGIDIRHPELTNAIAASFDALGSKEGAHVHGTGVAGAIAAHSRLIGSAPAARILAIRAFGPAPTGAESTSFVVLKALDYAAAHGAQIVNMSFAGPKDTLLERAIAAAVLKGMVMIAASGNAGPKSSPLYPAANANVIAVSATDSQDKLFSASNRGGHIAIAAPGVDIFLPAPDDKYQMTSGTSFSAAYISGIVALMLERNPALKPAEVRAILMKTARDLGVPGRDDLFGAGEADAYAAVAAAVPVTAASDASAAGSEKLPDRLDTPPAGGSNLPAAPAEKLGVAGANGAAAQ